MQWRQACDASASLQLLPGDVWSVKSPGLMSPNLFSSKHLSFSLIHTRTDWVLVFKDGLRAAECEGTTSLQVSIRKLFHVTWFQVFRFPTFKCVIVITDLTF